MVFTFIKYFYLILKLSHFLSVGTGHAIVYRNGKLPGERMKTGEIKFWNL